MTHSCPICHIDLTEATHNGVLFYECSQCAGIWILAKDLKSLQENGIQNLSQIDDTVVPAQEPKKDDSPRLCPSCQKEMVTFNYMLDTPIQLNRCEDCQGIWIDDGEMRQMAKCLEDLNGPIKPEELALASKVEVDLSLKEAEWKRSVQPKILRYFYDLCASFYKR